jgi:PAS domain S-box-containing protein
MSSWPLRIKVAAVLAAAFLGLAGATGIAWRTWSGDSELLSTVLVGVLVPFFVLLAIIFAITRENRARTAAAEKLRNQLSFTAAINDSLGEGVFAIDREGRLTFVNAAAQAMLGWKEEEILGSNMHEAIHFQQSDGTPTSAAICPLLAVLRTGARFHSEDDIFTRRDGTAFPVEFVSSPFLVDGRIVGAVIAFQDISERKKTEEELFHRAHQALFGAEVGGALTKAETLPRALGQCAEAMVRHLDASCASIWILSKQDNVLELKGGAWKRRPLFGPEARVPVGEFRIGGIARDRKPALLDLTVGPERDDDKDWARREGMAAFAGYPLIVEDRLVGVMAMFATRPLTDMTLNALASVADEIALGIDRALAAEALRASEARTRAVVDNMLEGLIIVDERILIRAVNPAAERIFGYRAEELLDGPLSVLVPESAGPDPVRFLKEARVRALGRVTQWEGRRKNGEVFPFELSLFEFRTPEGRRFGGSIRDISESREVERLKKEFVSTVSHELRTPLTSIRGSLGLLAGGVLGSLPPAAGEVVAMADRNVVRLVRLINDILDLERYDSGRIEMRFESVPLATVFERSLEAVQPFADQERVSIESTGTDARVRADADRLVQVLVNLLSNAVKFSPPGSVVRLVAVSDGGSTEVRVEDRGRGIPAPLRAAIFERFRQVDSSDDRSRGGSGLGLAICKAIVEQHGGSIGVESEEGWGSLFWFRLPATSSGQATLSVLSLEGAGAGA